MDESELIAHAREGDNEAFNELVIRYQNMLYSVAYRILGDEPGAADATQEAFFAAYRAIRRFRGGSFKAWLIRIVTNACYDCLRRAKRRPTVSFDSEEEADWQECLADSGELPEAWAERQDLSWQIQRALAALPPEQRAVVVLSDIHCLQYAEIAHILRIPLGTVRSRLSRARHALRDLLTWGTDLVPSYGDSRELGTRPAAIRS